MLALCDQLGHSGSRAIAPLFPHTTPKRQSPARRAKENGKGTPYFSIFNYMYLVCVYARQGTGLEVRVQLVGVSALIRPCGSQEWDSEHQS